MTNEQRKSLGSDSVFVWALFFPCSAKKSLTLPTLRLQFENSNPKKWMIAQNAQEALETLQNKGAHDPRAHGDMSLYTKEALDWEEVQGQEG